MVFFLRHVETFIHSLRSFVLMESMSKFTQTTYKIMNGFNGWVGRAANNNKRAVTVKRLSNRENRRNSSQMTKRSGKCGCTKCTRRKHKRKMEPSLLVANMGHQHHVIKENNPTADNFISKLQADDDKVEKVDQVQDHQHQHPEDYRKLQQTDYTERAWWTDMTHRVYMPPLMLQEPSSKPTRSECSSTSSGFKTARPDTPEYPLSPSSSVVFGDSDYQSCKNSPRCHLKGKSKSDQQINGVLGTEDKSPARSPSMPLGYQPNLQELRELKIIASRQDRIQNKERPVCRTTSHATDRFSNCVKCSRIVSKSSKKIKQSAYY
ncbi:uncharacterized protein LOC130677930 [Microplitis mediator]|uniref:uncharacterized protein LOC130677930 n=1 Tax=Microplitis mediator TaxID=375433 RepID=UPI00255417A4|nr:uncharacterized protein LOC130677930 [Microplitis mediator]